MSLKRYIKPEVARITPEDISNTIPLMMSGAGGDSGVCANIYILFNSNSAFGQGHAAILLEKPQTGYSGSVMLFSFSPYDNATDESPGAIASIKNSYDSYSFSRVISACRNGGLYVSNGQYSWREGFTHFIRFNIEFSFWNRAKSRASQIADNPPTYHLLSYNCMDFVLEIIEVASIHLKNEAGLTLVTSPPSDPNYYYLSISKKTTGVFSFEKGSLW